MKESILKLVTKPKNIFLLDGFGALLTTLLIFFVLRTFNDFSGLSKSTLEFLAALALLFSIYSVSCYFLVSNNWKTFLKIICTANILYCVLTCGILIYNYQTILIFGIVYFLGEMAIITGIVYLEIKIIRTDKYMETFETWNKIANLYEDKFMNLSIYNETYDFFCSLLKDHQKVFEIGCGPGNITKYLLSKRPDLKITGVDIAPKMIELAQKNNPTADFKIMDTRKLNEVNEKFHAIMCGFCLPYLSESDCSKLIRDAVQILTENGILYLSFVQGESSKSGFISGSSGDRTYFYYHSLEDLKTSLLENNFEIIKLFEVNYSKVEDVEIHTILIAKHSTF